MQDNVYHPEHGLLYWNTPEYKEQSLRLIAEIEEHIKNPSKNLLDSKNLSYHIQLRNEKKKTYLNEEIEKNKKLLDTLQIDYEEYKEFLKHPYFHKIPKEEPNPDTYFERQNEEIEKEIKSYQVEINKLDIIIRRNHISSEIKQLQKQLDDKLKEKTELETNRQLNLDVLQKLQHDILSARLENATFDYIKSSDENEQQINKQQENIRVLKNIILQLETNISSNNIIITELKNHIEFLNAQLLI